MDTFTEYTPYEDSDNHDVDKFRNLMDLSDPINKPPVSVIEFTVPNTIEQGGISQSSIDSLNELYSFYNTKYGLDLNFDVADLTASFKNIIDPKNKKIMELYLSEAFDRFKLVMYQRWMLLISSLMDKITQSLSSDTPIDHMFIMIEKALMYMEKVNTLSKELGTQFADLELEKLSQDASAEGSNTKLDIDDDEMREVFKNLNKTILKNLDDEQK